LALTSLTSGGRSVGMVRRRTKATEFVSFVFFFVIGGKQQKQYKSETVISNKLFEN
jgi:hypothetical protein